MIIAIENGIVDQNDICDIVLYDIKTNKYYTTVIPSKERIQIKTTTMPRWKKFWPEMPMMAIPAATIKDAHSKTESMVISSITPAYRFLVGLVEGIAR